MAARRALASLCSAVFYAFVVLFLIFRLGEWLPVVLLQPTISAAVLVAVLLSCIARAWLPSLPVPSLRLQLVVAAALVYYYWDVATAVRSWPEVDLTGRVAVVTGANSGIGFQTAVALLARNATVVMACRSAQKCSAAAGDAAELGSSAGRAIPMPLDLSDLASVRNFGKLLADDQPRVDILVNNAGFSGVGVGELQPPTTRQGLESYLGSMHVGHFALTELLLRQNRRGSEGVVVVNLASGMHHLCLLSFLAQLWSGEGSVGSGDDACLPESLIEAGFKERGATQDFLALPRLQARLPESLAPLLRRHHVLGDQRYSRAKLANVLHAAELPRRHPGLSAYSIDLGFVVTNVSSLFRLLQVPLGPLPPLQSLGLVRLAEPHGIRPVLLAACAPFAREWAAKQRLPALPNGGLVYAAGDGSEAFAIEERVEAILGLTDAAPNRTALAAALYDASWDIAAEHIKA